MRAAHINVIPVRTMECCTLQKAAPTPENRHQTGKILRPASVFRNQPAEKESAMPWKPEDAEKHTHKADTKTLKDLWAKVANECLDRTGDEGRAIREANAVVARNAET